MSLTKSTLSANNETVKRDWHVIDATDAVLGRVATRVAGILRGKHKPDYTPHVDTGDYVVIINVGKIRVTGKKNDDKMYHHHTSYPGGIVSASFKKTIARNADEPLKRAIRGMLPKGPLGRQMFSKLKLYATCEHPHAAQQPKVLVI